MCHRIFMQNIQNFSAKISINDLGILQGHLPPKALALIIEWASIYREELINNWKDLSISGNGSFKKIEP